MSSSSLAEVRSMQFEHPKKIADVADQRRWPQISVTAFLGKHRRLSALIRVICVSL
jgi:hypothetical protein